MQVFIGIDLGRLYRAGKMGGWRPDYARVLDVLKEQFRSELEPGEELVVRTHAYLQLDPCSERQVGFLSVLREIVDEVRAYGPPHSGSYTAEFMAEVLTKSNEIDSACLVTDDPGAFRAQALLAEHVSSDLPPLVLAYFVKDLSNSFVSNRLFQQSECIDLSDAVDAQVHAPKEQNDPTRVSRRGPAGRHPGG